MLKIKVIVITAFTAFAIAGFSTPAAADLQVGFETGITSITYGNDELLAAPAPVVNQVVLETREIREGTLRYNFEDAAVAEPAVSWNEATRTLTQSFDWGATRISYTPAGNRLNLALTIENKSDRNIANFKIELMRLQFSETPEALGNHGRIARSLDDLATVSVTWGDSKLVACVDTIYPPMRFGFDRPRNGQYPLVVQGGVPYFEEGAVECYPHGLPRIPAGESATFEFSLRFAGSEVQDHELIAELYEAFREFFVPMLNWEDRRPIGAIFLSGGGSQKSEKNPRGWGMRDFDMTSAPSMVDYRRRMLAHARRSAEILKGMDAQGVIIWNVEGEENPHPISYIGDPRMTKLMVPEFNSVADEYFAILREAGIRTGVTLRPTQVYFHEESKTWRHGTGSHINGRNPLDDDLDQFRPEGLPQWRFFPIVERMSRKIQYAKDRWGCTIFYVDTSGMHVPLAPENKFEWVMINGLMWKQILERHPDILIMPENRSGPAIFGYTAPYDQLDYSKRASTPAHVRRLFPDSFICNYIANTNRENMTEWTPRIIRAVRGGDIMMFRGWMNCWVNQWVTAFYDAASLFPPDATPTGEELLETVEKARQAQ